MVFARTAQEEDEQEAPGERRRPDEDARAGHRREKQRHLAGHLEDDEAYQPVRRPKDDRREAQAYPSLAASRVRTRRRVGHDRSGAHIQLVSLATSSLKPVRRPSARPRVETFVTCAYSSKLRRPMTPSSNSRRARAMARSRRRSRRPGSSRSRREAAASAVASPTGIVKPDSPSRETHGTPEYGIDVLITGHPLAIAST